MQKNKQNYLIKKIMQNLWQAPVQIKLNPGDALMTMQKQFQRGEYKFYNKELLLQLKTNDEECESLKLDIKSQTFRWITISQASKLP